MKRMISLCLLLLASCQTQPQKDNLFPPEPIIKEFKSRVLFENLIPTTNYARWVQFKIPPFIASNKKWFLRGSSNLQDWVVVPDNEYFIRTNGTNFYLEVIADQPQRYFQYWWPPIP